MSAFELLIVALAVILGSLVKGVTGLGLPLTAVPVIAFFVGVQDAVVIMAAPTAFSNALLVREYRGELRSVRGLPSFAMLGGVGAVLGASLLPRINDQVLFLLLASLLTCFLVWRFFSVEPRWSPGVQQWGWIPVAVTCGVAQGATGISGPLVAAWFQGLGVSRERFIISNTTIFLLTGVMQLITLTATDQWSNQRLLGSALAAAVVAFALPFGIRLGRRLEAERFHVAVSAVITVCTISLVFRAF
ncbi:MAG: sulfite exporter TauE/SafE family protein [Actinomycetota bacterium]|nr:sulfite exporter TauE/SafE family protein [Actinomycetota bacterium]MED5292515.1 sulfite exporter TauE/SafE family protein [Actinomycetota bacterium]